MIITIKDDFNLEKIAESGQCFRWEIIEPGTYRIIAGTICLYITELGNDQYDLSCSEQEYDTFWQKYFDLQEDYRNVRKRIDPEEDPFMWQAAEREKGIRILRQEPWEMLITFIISQNKNIPAIHRSVELLAQTSGEKKTDAKGVEYYTFPTPQAVETLTKDQLIACKLGYRWKYVHAAAEAIATGKINLNQLLPADENTTISTLTEIYGVGKKVANCISLFGLHHLNAFPEDVWIKRILTEQYPQGYPFKKYTPYNGIYQQYMFAHYRHINNSLNV